MPDHSTFSKNRHGRFRNSHTLRFVFEKVLERCLAEGLVGGEGFAIDASVIKADANRQRGVPGSDASWDRESSLTRPVREYLEALDAAEEARKPPKNVSLTDPAAQWTAAPGGPAFYAYSTNYLIDTKAGVILDVEATPAHRTNEVNATKVMVDRVEERFEIKPTHLIGDTAYGTAEMLGWMVDEKAIEPHVPVSVSYTHLDVYKRQQIPMGTKAVAVAISVSYLVDPQAINKSLLSVPIVELTLPNRSPDNHWSEAKQQRLSKEFLAVMIRLADAGVSVIHLFLAAQNSVVFRLGRAYDKRNLPGAVSYTHLTPSIAIACFWV